MASVDVLSQWVDVTVLGEEPLVDAEFITHLRTHHRICTSEEDEPKYELVVPGPEDRVCLGRANEAALHFFFMYECMITRLGVFLPFSHFEMSVLHHCRVAPTQLHPNSWGFLKIYQFISHALDFPTSLRIFFYLFHMTKPFSGLNNKQQWVSFRAIQGRRIFTLFDESFHDFKNYFFKVQAVEGHHPFFLDENFSPRFPLYWLEASPCEKYGLDDLDEVEAAIVGFFREVWGRAPYLDTRKFLQGSPNFVRSQLDMARKNAQESYQRVQEAKAKSRARAGGARAIISPPPPPPPPPQNVGTPSQPIVISSSALSRPLPSARLLSEPKTKKRKTLESGSSFDGGVKADALAFVRKNIYPHISMNDVSVQNHLTTLAEESFRAAGVCGKLLDIFEKTSLSSLGLTSKVEELEGRLLSYQEHERELKEEVAKLRAERDSLREKESKLRAQCNMEASLRKTAQESYQSLFQDLVSVKKDLLNSRNAYAELEDSVADGAEEAWRIFKEQVGVIVPDLDLSPLDPDKVVIDGAIVDPPAPVIVSESEFKTRGQRIIESPPRSKDASSSSVVPPISSSSPVVASLPDPGGALPDSGGGDPSTPLQK
ncbi:uncharacterized protein LOC110269081 [Arachis ipaensis]|uniref:uncharacterized protein LOC110269081 n=1 Tax=Arachis ipaensis TaxID=130454 RepID=UPI000A2B57A4|nr:uncharacterized protein LOC110269081 [Arachis ipaensis]